MSNPKMAVYESMSRWRVGPYIVRVWRNENGWPPDGNDYDVTDLGACCKAIQPSLVDGHRYQNLLTKKQIICAFYACGRVNAVEIVDTNGWGIVAYREWP